MVATPMPGRMSVVFSREPSYFDAAVLDGSLVQVGVARDVDSGRIVGMGSRSVSLRYVDGRPCRVGYLGGLRLLPEFRGQAALLVAVIDFFASYTGTAPQFYLTTIAADNVVGSNVLASGRAGLPRYHPWGKYCTLCISANATSKLRTVHDDGLHVRTATLADRQAIVEYLRNYGPTRNFFPAYAENDLFASTGLLRGLTSDDVLLALRGREIVGTLASWNQREFKQLMVSSYAGWLRTMRPLINAFAALRGHPKLPPKGSVINARLAAIPVVRDDNRDVFQRLLRTMLQSMARHGQPLLMFGLHEKDPLLPEVRRVSGIEYCTKLYIVYWSDEPPDVVSLNRRVPYLELGAL